MKDIILIGGAAGSGKSTVAKELAQHFQIPWISTDQVRRILRPTETDEAKKLELVWAGTSELLHGVDPWEGGIIEGTAILPRFVARDLKDVERRIKPVFLIQTEDQITRIVFERSLLPYIKTKTPEQQAERVQQIARANQEILESAQANGYPYIQARTATTFEDVLKVVV